MDIKAISVGVLIAVLFQATSTEFAGSSVQIPSIPPDHPRVYVRPADLPSIREKLYMPEFIEDWTMIRSNHRPLSKAFVYLMTRDERIGRAAVEEGLSDLKQCIDARSPDNAMHWGACVYDWCYDLVSSSQRQEFIREFVRIAASHSPGYPANPNGHAVVGHGTEGWLLTDQLPAGLAIYDESRQMFEAAAQLFFSKFVPVRNFFYPAHMHHQGDSYISTRLQHDLLASWLFRRIDAGDVFSHELQYVPYQLIYHLRPDGQQMRSGDTFDPRGTDVPKRRLMMLAGAYYEDPYLLTMADSDFYYGPSSYDRIFKLLFQRPGLERRPLDELALSKYFAEPMGEMIARTGWRMGMDSPDAVVHMRIGEYFFGNHQRKDFGTFQIYCRGPLAIASGIYEGVGQPYGSAHWLNYHHQTIAHNGLLIYDPSEVMAKGAANDGGQRWPSNGDYPRDLSDLLEHDYRMGKVTAHAIEPDSATPVFSYLAGDITDAYDAGKAEMVTRSMITVNTGDPARPCVLVVFDRVISTNPLFKKTWLLHSIQEPQIRGTTSYYVFRTGKHYEQDVYYSGRMIVDCLLPEDVSVTKIGGPGKEFWIESTNRDYPSTRGGAAEPGAWRIEVSPAIPNRRDTFLHVLTVVDVRVPVEKAAELVSNTDLVGASFSNHAIFFSRDGTLLETADVPLDTLEEKTIFVCDLRPGLWSLKGNDSEGTTVRVDEQAKSLYLDKPQSPLRLEYLSP